eukprot:CAMPEP_0119009264 /NCGR_PEP_ID=MMETSP1176-20130426/4241_1 /TAXON_ID=265551 /ORGANISM="Synedropsis recta cf, Strain CCMP1620" /LENGTH=217 /DNA_ID=CAMNT_0006961739 /DNA_START=111 /DNA_END=764 /DNA_ORIENTATION=+
MSTLQDSQTSVSMWADVEFNASLSAEFSDVINDDFLIVDGLHDDFSGFPDIDAASMFNNDESKSDFSTSKGDEENAEVVTPEEAPSKKLVREDRSRSPSPTPKRRRSADHSPMDISPKPVKAISSMGQESLDDLQSQYKAAVEQLAVSMRRSEMTRAEIISYRKSQETRNRLQQAQSRTFNSADGFLTGSQVTLTTGLAQSRQMLKNYMSLVKSPAL